MAADHAVLPGAQAFDGALAGEVEVVGAPAHHMAAELVKGVPHHQQLGGGVDVGALHALAVPGVANLHPAHGRQDVVEAGAAQHQAAGVVQHSKGKAVALGASFQRGLDVGTRVLRLGHRGDAQLPQFTVGSGIGQTRYVFQAQGLQAHVAVSHHHGFNKTHALAPMSVFHIAYIIRGP
jgi:hypothetical protein